ncbi:MAG: hypothetical protein Q9195_009646 [Heterodermia aff. obscurata]
MASCTTSKDLGSGELLFEIPYKARYYSYAEASLAIDHVKYFHGKVAHKLRFIAIHLHKAGKEKASKKHSFGPDDVIYYVLCQASVFQKGAHEVTLRDVGELECLYYAICGKVKEFLYDINIRLDNNFVSAEDEYITYMSEGFGLESVTIGDFKDLLLSYEAFLYSPEILKLMKEGFKAKHIREHKSGSRPIFLDPRHMSSGMIFGSLREKYRAALQDQNFEESLKTMPHELATLHRQNRYSAGIRMRAIKICKANASSPTASGDLSRNYNDQEEDKKGPQYLEYLDEYSVMSIDSFTTSDSEEELEEPEAAAKHTNDTEDPMSSEYAHQQVRRSLTRPSKAHDIGKQDDRMEITSNPLEKKEQKGSSASTQLYSSKKLGDLSQQSYRADSPKPPCICTADCLCAPLCAAEPTETCLCIENSLFVHMTRNVNIEDIHYPRKKEEEAEAARAGQQYVAQIMDMGPAQQQSVQPVSSAEYVDLSTDRTAYMTSELAANTRMPTDCAHVESRASLLSGVRPDITDVIAKKLFGGSLSIFAVELPNGERVRNCESEWHNQLRAAMDAHRDRYEPDPDWYFPPGATCGRLRIGNINQQFTLRKRILDKTVGNITGKKAMCQPAVLKEGLQSPTLEVPSLVERSAHRKPGFLFNLFTLRFGHRIKTSKMGLEDTLGVFPQVPY